MERKIGEIFEFDGEWYQCVGGTCRICSFYYDTACKNITTIGSTNFGNCHCSLRTDHKSVIFKKLEKIGEPYELYGHLVQKYRFFYSPAIQVNGICISKTINTNNIIEIEIKQIKEDMEEKNLNLKPFDLEAAKAGKPVCTRDGRKARIICFDRKDNTPIVALIERVDGIEILQCFYNDGKCFHDSTSDNDLMILIEKKEGWVNVYREESNNNERLMEPTIYKTRKDAFDNACPKGYITTTKINWEE